MSMRKPIKRKQGVKQLKIAGKLHNLDDLEGVFYKTAFDLEAKRKNGAEYIR